MSILNQNQINQSEMLKRAQEKGKIEAHNEKVTEIKNRRRIKQASSDARKEMKKDFQAGAELGQEILGDGLGRIKDDEGVKSVRDMLRKQAGGMSEAETNAQREAGLRQVQGQQQAASRQLSASLSRSGVKGGAAGQQQVELAAQGLQARRDLERDLFIQQKNLERQGTANLAQFEVKTTEFDLAQAAKEKNIMLQTQLASAQLGSNERSAITQQIASENAAKLEKKGNSGGTVLCTAMYKHGLITTEEWKADVEAGLRFIKDKSDRKAFLLYNKKCKGLANLATKSKLVAKCIAPIIVPISRHFSDGNMLGTVLFKLFRACFKLGVFLSEVKLVKKEVK